MPGRGGLGRFYVEKRTKRGLKLEAIATPFKVSWLQQDSKTRALFPTASEKGERDAFSFPERRKLVKRPSNKITDEMQLFWIRQKGTTLLVFGDMNLLSHTAVG